MRILASDVGGTHVRLAYVEDRGGRLVISGHETLLSAQYGGFEEALAEYLSRNPGEFDVASFSIAAPIIDGVAKFPNLPWKLSRPHLSQVLKQDRIFLLNDLEAQAYGLGELSGEQLVVLQAGRADADGNCALVAPGTGLGQAMIHRRDGQLIVLKSEGGHVSFGATNELEWDLLHFLEGEMEHVSWEALLSGPGLFRLYRFLRSRAGVEESPATAEALRGPDPQLVISRVGLSGENPIAVQTLDLFVDLLAMFAGNVALEAFAAGGVYLGGGIVPSLLPRLQQPNFGRKFARKGRMSGLLQNFPITAVRSDMLGILGAARFASRAWNGTQRSTPGGTT
jgi:glucokinase